MFVGKPKHIYHPETGETTIVPEYYKEDEYLVMAALSESKNEVEKRSNPEPISFSDVEYDPNIDPMNMEQYNRKIYKVIPVFQKELVDDSVQTDFEIDKGGIGMQNISDEKVGKNDDNDSPPRYEDIFTESDVHDDNYGYSSGASSPYKELEGGDREKRAGDRHSHIMRVHRILAACLFAFVLMLLAGQKIQCYKNVTDTTERETQPTKMCDTD